MYANLLNEAKDSAKKTWDIMKEIIGKKKNPTNVLPKELSVNDKLISDRNNIAESLNNFFVNVGTDLASKIPATTKSFEYYLEKQRLIIHGRQN